MVGENVRSSGGREIALRVVGFDVDDDDSLDDRYKKLRCECVILLQILMIVMSIT